MGWMETNAAHMSERKEGLPERLRRLRERRQVKRCILAELCGLNRNAIKLYEEGEVKPGQEALESMADYFEVSVDYLLGRTDYPKSL